MLLLSIIKFQGLTSLLIYSAIVAWKQAQHGKQPTDVHQSLPWTEDGLSL
jgi:hypothetical protein